jgi:hypothetical protein
MIEKVVGIIFFGAGLAAFAWLSWERFKFRQDGRRWEDQDLER